MKSSDSRKGFEENWEMAFRNATKKPPDAVWEKIDTELTGTEVLGYKKRIVFFKWLAAASVLLALGMGFYSFYYGRGNSGVVLDSSSPVAQTYSSDTTNGTGIKSNNLISDNNQKGEISDSNGEESLPQHGALNDAKETKKTIDVSDSPLVAVLSDDKSDMSGIEYDEAMADRENEVNGPDVVSQAHLLALPEQIVSISGLFGIEKPDLLVDYMYRRPVVPVDINKKEKNQPMQLYAGLSFSAGMFDPNFEGGSPENFNGADLAIFSNYSARALNTVNVADNAVISNESYQPDISYSYGINMGARVVGRWVLRGGISYIKANTIANSSAYYQNNSNNDKFPVLKSVNYQNDGVVEIRQTENIQFANTFEFASIPIKAGYVVVDKKINLTVLGGISTEFFLKNTITQKENLTNVYENDNGAESPYRPVYFNGSLSTALGYTIDNHYHFSLEPGYRMALNSFTKDSFILVGRPDAFYLNIGFSYWFK